MVGTVLPLALVVGLSPLPILPAVMLLMTPRGRSNGWAYFGAWVLALTLVVLVAVGLGTLADPSPATDEGIGWIQVVTGAVFLTLAAVKWVRRSRAGEAKDPPAWMLALDSYAPRQAARLGALLASANPKNLAMALAAGAEIALLAESAGATVAGVAAFVAIGSLGVATPILGSAALGARATPALERGRAWLVRHSTTLSVGVLAVLGVLLLLRGLPSSL